MFIVIAKIEHHPSWDTVYFVLQNNITAAMSVLCYGALYVLAAP